MAADRVYILGGGAIGLALAVHLTDSGRHVTVLRTSAADIERQIKEITLCAAGGGKLTTPVEMESLARIPRLDGIAVVAAKSYANTAIAATLRGLELAAPLIIMQNGVAVEDPFVALERAPVYRCVLYATGQKEDAGRYTFTPVKPSPIGVVRGSEAELSDIVDILHTEGFPFTPLANIQAEVWKKAAINCVFNSICPLLETDNGIFIRNGGAARLAREIVDECARIMARLGFAASAEEIMSQLVAISKRSDGQLISTLQDINNGCETEIEHLNLGIARIAAQAAPDLKISTTRTLGELVKIKSELRRG